MAFLCVIYTYTNVFVNVECLCVLKKNIQILYFSKKKKFFLFIIILRLPSSNFRFWNKQLCFCFEFYRMIMSARGTKDFFHKHILCGPSHHLLIWARATNGRLLSSRESWCGEKQLSRYNTCARSELWK